MVFRSGVETYKSLVVPQNLMVTLTAVVIVKTPCMLLTRIQNSRRSRGKPPLPLVRTVHTLPWHHSYWYSCRRRRTQERSHNFHTESSRRHWSRGCRPYILPWVVEKKGRRNQNPWRPAYVPSSGARQRQRSSSRRVTRPKQD